MTLASPADLSPLPEAEPSRDCPLCPRLVAFREQCRVEYPDWYNAPVPAFGDRNAWLGIVGLAPGKHGANRTGRPFTGDYAGDLLFATFAKYGLSDGDYRADPTDGLRLKGAIIINAVKCLPPANKPEPLEIRTCQVFLQQHVELLANVRVFIALGQIAHTSACRVLGISYHCSRYNTNTGRLSAAMFESVFERALELRGR